MMSFDENNNHRFRYKYRHIYRKYKDRFSCIMVVWPNLNGSPIMGQTYLMSLVKFNTNKRFSWSIIIYNITVLTFGTHSLTKKMSKHQISYIANCTRLSAKCPPCIFAMFDEAAAQLKEQGNLFLNFESN